MAVRNYCYWDFDDYGDQLYSQAEYERIACGITLATLRTLPEAELVSRYDWLVQNETGHCETVSWYTGADEYQRELDRRGTDRLARRVYWLTAVATIAAVLSVLGAGYGFYRGDGDTTANVTVVIAS